ncbi:MULTISPECIES: hypothetical protein [unclassified Janthinobacterium]|uniref:hypothetical protein n=1 Tax=Janthinobacterium sp. 75 TaxID=2135628 RepID=UPI001FBBD4A3|nr:MULTISPECIES: hypothetical protein [unclassified Janthinobacterium]
MAALATGFAWHRGGSGCGNGKRRAAGRTEFCARFILGLAGKAFQLASLFISTLTPYAFIACQNGSFVAVRLNIQRVYFQTPSCHKRKLPFALFNF